MKIDPDNYVVSRTIPDPFVLNKDIFLEIVEMLENGADEAKTVFLVRMKDGTLHNLANSKDVMAIRNSHDNPISVLEITTQFDALENHGSVKLDGEKKEVTTKVVTTDRLKSNDIFSALQQKIIDNVLDRQGCNSRKLTGVLIAFVLFFIIAGAVFYTSQYLNMVSFKNAGLVSIMNKYSGEQSVSKKIEFLYDIHLFDITTSLKLNKQPQLSGLKYVLSVFLLPPVVILTCLVYLRSKCYPQNIFAWGIYGKEYDAIQRRRKVIWQTGILCFAIGIVTNIFSYGIINLIVG
jgi:hypothetical protein